MRHDHRWRAQRARTATFRCGLPFLVSACPSQGAVANESLIGCFPDGSYPGPVVLALQRLPYRLLTRASEWAGAGILVAVL